MSIQKTKDVTINDREFRIGLVSARTGDWILTRMLSRTSSDFETYSKIQDLLLGTCSIYKTVQDGTRVPMKLYEDGRWLIRDEDLEYDTDTIHALCDAVLGFNFDPFFEKLKARAAAQIQATPQ